MFQNVEVEGERVDERSVDDLLSFINGVDGGTIFLLLPSLLVHFFPFMFVHGICMSYMHGDGTYLTLLQFISSNISIVLDFAMRNNEGVSPDGATI